MAYRPRILYPLGMEDGKGIPVPKEKLPEIEKYESNVETGMSRFMKTLKPFTPEKIKEKY